MDNKNLYAINLYNTHAKYMQLLYLIIGIQSFIMKVILLKAISNKCLYKYICKIKNNECKTELL